MTDINIKLNAWKIPNNFHAVPSAVEGITVFAPIPEAEVQDIGKTFKCPNCGATTSFDVASGGVACEHCGYVAAVQAEKVGLKAGVFEFTLEALKQAEKGWGVERPELHCESCGADLAVEKTAISVTCPFCASNKVNLREAAEDHLRPRFVIPFKIQNKDLPAYTQKWLGQGWFHPNNLANFVKLDRFIGIYLPFWTFDSGITSDWKAEVGYERTERYYNASTKEWDTRTVIDWRWEDGRVNVNIQNLIVMGSKHISRTILERVLPFNLDELMTYAPDYLAGWQAQAYDVPLPEAWEEGKTKMREKAKDACYKDIPTSHVRNFSMSADFDNESWRYVLLPIYLASYKYEDKIFQVMVNGQTGVVAGQKPVDWRKVWTAIIALLAPGVLLGMIGLPLLLAGGVGIVPLALGVVLFIIGVIISVIIYQNAVASEAA